MPGSLFDDAFICQPLNVFFNSMRETTGFILSLMLNYTVGAGIFSISSEYL
jgi:hypothetical protein